MKSAQEADRKGRDSMNDTENPLYLLKAGKLVDSDTYEGRGRKEEEKKEERKGEGREQGIDNKIDDLDRMGLVELAMKNITDAFARVNGSYKRLHPLDWKRKVFKDLLAKDTTIKRIEEKLNSLLLRLIGPESDLLVSELPDLAKKIKEGAIVWERTVMEKAGALTKTEKAANIDTEPF